MIAADSDQRELRDRVIERVARVVVERRLETPAVLFLESNRPLRFFVGQGLLMSLPLIGSFVPPADVEALSRILDSEHNLDALIARIETLARERDGAPRARRGGARDDGTGAARRPMDQVAARSDHRNADDARAR